MIKPDRGGGGGIPSSERGRESEGTEGTRYYSSQGVSFPLSSCCFHLEPPKGGGGRGRRVHRRTWERQSANIEREKRRNAPRKRRVRNFAGIFLDFDHLAVSRTLQ